jgi:hypothetical protein
LSVAAPFRCGGGFYFTQKSESIFTHTRVYPARVRDRGRFFYIKIKKGKKTSKNSLQTVDKQTAIFYNVFIKKVYFT